MNKETFMNTVYSLQDIKNNYYQALSWEKIENMGLNEYIKEYYVQMYDINLNFIGYGDLSWSQCFY